MGATVRPFGLALGGVALAVFSAGASPSAAISAQAPPTIGSPESVMPPCFAPADVDTSGWKTIRWYSDARRFTLRLPPTFREDSTVRFSHGARAWVAGKRRLFEHNGMGAGFVCWPGDGFVGCSECQDTLAGIGFTLVSSFSVRDSLYNLAAVHGPRSSGWFSEFTATSPDPEDQRTFLAVFRSLREVSWVATRGTLFLGGHRLEPPYVFTEADGRIAVGGLTLPDVLPPRVPAPNAELETRRAIRKSLLDLRDSLRAAGVDWRGARGVLSSRAMTSTLVDTVVQSNRTLQVRWPWGYRFFEIYEGGGSSQFGSAGAFEQTEDAALARLEYLERTLDEGGVLFLLGGGAEYVVGSAKAGPTLEAVNRLLNGEELTGTQGGLIPEDVRAQLRSPLILERRR